MYQATDLLINLLYGMIIAYLNIRKLITYERSASEIYLFINFCKYLLYYTNLEQQ